MCQLKSGLKMFYLLYCMKNISQKKIDFILNNEKTQNDKILLKV